MRTTVRRRDPVEGVLDSRGARSPRSPCVAPQARRVKLLAEHRAVLRSVHVALGALADIALNVLEFFGGEVSAAAAACARAVCCWVTSGRQWVTRAPPR